MSYMHNNEMMVMMVACSKRASQAIIKALMRTKMLMHFIGNVAILQRKHRAKRDMKRLCVTTW